MKDEDVEVHRAAVMRVTDRRLLADIAKNAKNKNVRRAAKRAARGIS
jgi:hypothetical protein